MTTFLSRLFGGNSSDRVFNQYKKIVDRIGSFEQEYSLFTDSDFPKKTEEFKSRLQNKESLDDILPEAFALVREASKRVLGQRHYDVQLIGGIIIHRGGISEMRTGEGKTLVATLPAYLNALTGRGVHIVTVNDYLAKRDATWMGQVFSFLGLSTAVINGQNTSFLYDASVPAKEDAPHDNDESFKVVSEKLQPCSRRDAYRADITYGTNSEFGFDYLRDNLVHDISEVSAREYNFAIVDEIDSILIDEARTPLIISQSAEDSDQLYKTCSRIAETLQPNSDFTIDEKLKAIALTDSGITKAEKALGVDNIYTEKGIKYVHHIETAVRARALFHKDKDYVVKDKQIVIVDAFTGRLQPGRRWSEGLHQAIEAKENVPIERETRTVASITYQNFFRFYKKLSGMTGTAETSKEEFFKVYGLHVTQVPTHRKPKRIDNPDLIFQTEEGKWKAIARKVKELQEKGQPVLIGTVSIEKNELLSAYLLSEGVKHTVLNAKNHEKEGEIIANAGSKGSVVVATNMAGRGVDIKLGGVDATEEESEEVKKLGGLFVLGTERHEARRIDNQLRGRAGRQGDTGETQFYVSLEDDLMRVFGSERIKNMMGRFGIPEDQPIQNSLVSRALETAQKRIEGFHFDARKHTLEYDNVLNLQRSTIYTRRKTVLEGDRQHLESFIQTLIEVNPEADVLIKEKEDLLGKDYFWQQVRAISLYVIDMLWMDHLETMDYVRSSVNLRAYGQKEPLIEYKREALRLFKDLEYSQKHEILRLILTLEKPENA